MNRVTVAFPIWFAMAGALVEVLVLYFKRTNDPLISLSPDFAWMAPLALLAITTASVAVLSLVAMAWRPGFLESIRLIVPLGLVSLNLLMLVPGLAHYAAAILAAGIAVQLARLVLARPDSTMRLVRRMGAPVMAVLLALAALVTATSRPGAEAVASAPQAERRPNLLFITLDTVRAASLSAYGYSRKTTPNLDRYARQGAFFEHAFSTAPWTLPSHASMFTARWPHELSTTHEAPLDRKYPTLAEYLRDRGYATAGFVANLKYVGAATGLNRGFAHYEDYTRSIGEIASSSTVVKSVANNFRLRRFIQNDEHINRISAGDITARALAWIRAQGDSPYFAFLNYFDAHEPYLPPAPFDRQFGPGRQHGRHSPLHHWLWNPAVRHRPFDESVRQEEIDAYDGGLAHLDAEIGELLDALRDQQGLLRNTLVVITSDHGEEFGEHGVYEHGYSLYRQSVQVPLIILLPGPGMTAVQGPRVSTPVSLRDLPATVVDLLRLNDGSPFPGRSLWTLWRGLAEFMPPQEPSPILTQVSPSPGQPDWFPSSKGEMKSLVHQGMRYIRNGDGREELYDFANDPRELTDLAKAPEHQAVLAGARTALDRLLAGGS